MAPPKKRKRDEGQKGISRFFLNTVPNESTGGEEGRVTGVEEQVRGAEGGDVSESNQPSASNSIGDPDRGTGSKHRKSGWDPDWLKKPKYSQWLYQTQHGKLQFVVICIFFI